MNLSQAMWPLLVILRRVRFLHYSHCPILSFLNSVSRFQLLQIHLMYQEVFTPGWILGLGRGFHQVRHIIGCFFRERIFLCILENGPLQGVLGLLSFISPASKESQSICSWYEDVHIYQLRQLIFAAKDLIRCWWYFMGGQVCEDDLGMYRNAKERKTSNL